MDRSRPVRDPLPLLLELEEEEEEEGGRVDCLELAALLLWEPGLILPVEPTDPGDIPVHVKEHAHVTDRMTCKLSTL